MLVGIILVQRAKAYVVRKCAGAFCIQLLHVDLAHIGVVGDVSLSVGGNDCLLIDPPVGVRSFDLAQNGALKIDHGLFTFPLEDLLLYKIIAQKHVQNYSVDF